MSSSLRFSVFIALLFLFSLFQNPALAVKQSYIVYLGEHSHDARLNAAELDQLVVDSHHDLLASFLGSEEKAKDAIFYSYKKHINGFAAILEEEEAAQIAKHPNVVSVFLDKGRELHTTHSWSFLMLEDNNGGVRPSSLWNKARYGEDTIIANLDTGVWPESKSFSDDGYGPVPSKWRGICQNETIFPCNKKLIGGRFFNKAYLKLAGKLNASMNCPRDFEGHGSHTLSTAGGNFVPGARVYDFKSGTVKGGSPRARVATYKVCWPQVNNGECIDSDIINGFDHAIHDGVDVISVSLGGIGAADYLEDGIAIGSFHAVKKGMVVVCSAGNSGILGRGAVTNIAPWIITVAASTLDRALVADVVLNNGQRLEGQSLSKPLPEDRLYPLINAADATAASSSANESILCKPGTLDAEKVKGKILVCLRGGNGRVDKGVQALLAGAAGLILVNDKSTGNETVLDFHVLPATHITYSDGLALYAYLNSTKHPMAYLKPLRTKLGRMPAPLMASFSSMGPNLGTSEILKPDITAPGVQIIAANSEAEQTMNNNRTTPYILMQGTSMSCPHVAGVVGLLKTLHPKWSAAAIKSAIMTTARTRDNTVNPMLDGSEVKASPFNYGAGHIRPNRAMDPGLVYDLTVNDYLDFLCGNDYNSTMLKTFSDEPYNCPKDYNLLNFNYPAITVPKLSGTVTVSRTLKNVGTPGTYTARIRQPVGFSISVEPTTLTFDNVGEEKSFKLTLKPWARGVSKDYVFGELLWSDGKHYVRSPIVVRPAVTFAS